MLLLLTVRIFYHVQEHRSSAAVSFCIQVSSASYDTGSAPTESLDWQDSCSEAIASPLTDQSSNVFHQMENSLHVEHRSHLPAEAPGHKLSITCTSTIQDR
ncbi:hypothetical protein DOTSEDRAFT_74738 [Dothistroma septosporum NZE10]|uniref:Uncharacterized protein n=1 Tax=Dothistroma septosporum (strain NZE10 / CBS 128990) TaxID=675120 RepID=N1PD16_DOTSN|nr:hypothetical protein DOTSEDRAFT_74738 [Dothistroma septosporum NZE10]